VHGGKRVLVLERHYAWAALRIPFAVRGMSGTWAFTTWQVQDDTSSVRACFRSCDRRQSEVERHAEVYDRIIVNGQTFDLTRGLEQYGRA